MTAPDTGPVTEFHDMHSGGGTKTEFDRLYVELPEDEAIEWFERTFHRDPFNVTCGCCGQDFAVMESRDLRQATAYERGCEFDKERDEYVEKPREYSSFEMDHVTLHEFLSAASRDPQEKDARYLVVLEDDLDPEAVGVY